MESCDYSEDESSVFSSGSSTDVSTGSRDLTPMSKKQRENYLQGKSRKPYSLRHDLERSLSDSSTTSTSGV